MPAKVFPEPLHAAVDVVFSKLKKSKKRQNSEFRDRPLTPKFFAAPMQLLAPGPWGDGRTGGLSNEKRT